MIIQAEIKNIKIELIKRHPANRPTGINPEKVDLIKHSIISDGYRSSKPIVVRPSCDHFEIIEGEHRFLACKELGFDEIPCSIEDIDDLSALLRLVTGNFQTENHALDIGANAAAATTKYDHNGLSIKDYAERTGISLSTISQSVQAWTVYDHIKNVCPGANILTEHKKLYEISKCQQSDWTWLHDLIVEHNLSKNITVEISKTIRKIDSLITHSFVAGLIDIQSAKVKISTLIATDKQYNKEFQLLKKLIESMQSAYDGLDENAVIFYYNELSDEIISQGINPKNDFIESLKRLEKIKDSDCARVAKELHRKVKSMTEQKAKREMEYHRNKENKKQIEEQKRLEQDQIEAAFGMYLECKPFNEIVIEIGEKPEDVSKMIESGKMNADFDMKYFKDEDFQIPIYNVWTAAKATNETEHFGMSEQRFFENLVYLYTEPFDIVFDPFGGGGSTIDVCKKRFRRYYVSDQQPIESRSHEIRMHDITNGLPDIDWKHVRLVYLDPPYWRQALNQYSDSDTNLANMDLPKFNETLLLLINEVSEKIENARIALIIQPTQWNAPDKKFTDHVMDIIKNVNLKVEIRIQAPYSTQQCTPQMVEWAKKNKQCLVLSREIIVWGVE